MARPRSSDDDKPLTLAQARQKLQKGIEDYLAGKDTGPIVFRLKRTKKASFTYPLKLTEQQRQTLLEHAHLKGKLKKKIQEAGEGTQLVPVTWNELHKLNEEIGQAAVYARNQDKKRLMAVMSRVNKFFEEEHAEVFNFNVATSAKGRRAESDLLFQFKITLLGIKPPIWRRIQVHDCTLDKLHEHIQTSMGWTNSHLHEFQIKGKRYGDRELRTTASTTSSASIRQKPTSAKSCPRTASGSRLNTCTTSATAGNTRSCSRAIRRSIPR